MYDLYHEWGVDLTAGSSGDLALVTDTAQINQRVLRRLLTNPGDYIWNLNYGGGLAMFVGSTASPAAIEAVVRAQMLLEAAVPVAPAPTVDVELANNATGYVVAQITYANPSSGGSVGFNVIAS